ncbi:hypothetical protein, partial [Hyphomonas sp. ND6WE1B]|uniref:hypothetical protein n=1 Tax=Hyphomonas sp. ND6WE1B TaxID=1848191 RepID=UPI001F223641
MFDRKDGFFRRRIRIDSSGPSGGSGRVSGHGRPLIDISQRQMTITRLDCNVAEERFRFPQQSAESAGKSGAQKTRRLGRR